MITTTQALRYAERQGFGDYSKADYETREAVADAPLEYARYEQARANAQRAQRVAAHKERVKAAWEAGTASARDCYSAIAYGFITKEQRNAYYQMHGWTMPKFH